MNIGDIFLKHYCHINNEPLRSITQLREKEALEMAKKLRDENPCGAHSRFGPIFDEAFVEYYNRRKNVENILYEQFVALGGKPQISTPYYFFVQDWGQLHTNYIVGEINNGTANIIEVNLQDIDISDVSFVLGDSMAGSNEWTGILLKDTLMEAITSHGGFENYFDSIKPQYPYIEAQLWTDNYRHLLRSV
jgi:hypothetical protein